MQSLQTNFYQRVMLSQLIGNHPTPTLKESSVFLRLLEKIRLTDQEMLDTQFFVDGPRLGWKLPDVSYGNKELELEHEEAKALITAIEGVTSVKVTDAAWLTTMVEELKIGQPTTMSVS